MNKTDFKTLTQLPQFQWICKDLGDDYTLEELKREIADYYLTLSFDQTGPDFFLDLKDVFEAFDKFFDTHFLEEAHNFIEEAHNLLEETYWNLEETYWNLEEIYSMEARAYFGLKSLDHQIGKSLLTRKGLEPGLGIYLEPADSLSVLKGHDLSLYKLSLPFLLSKPYQPWMLNSMDDEHTTKPLTVHPSWVDQQFFQQNIFPKVVQDIETIDVPNCSQKAIDFLSREVETLSLDSFSYLDILTRASDVHPRSTGFVNFLELPDAIKWLEQTKDRKLLINFVKRIVSEKECRYPKKESALFFCAYHPWVLDQYRNEILPRLDPELVRKSPWLCGLFDSESFSLFLRNSSENARVFWGTFTISAECFDNLYDAKAIDDQSKVSVPYSDLELVKNWEAPQILKLLFESFCKGNEVDLLKLEHAYQHLCENCFDEYLREKFIFHRACSDFSQGKTRQALVGFFQTYDQLESQRIVARVVEEKIRKTPPKDINNPKELLAWLLMKM